MKILKRNWNYIPTGEVHQSCGFGYRITDEKSDYYIASINGITDNISCKANAKLIAAAPELLEHLIRCVDRLEENGFSHMSAVKRAKDVIRKVTINP